MSDKQTFMVAMIGIPDHERNVLKNIFKLSLYRSNCYTFSSINEPGHIWSCKFSSDKVHINWPRPRPDECHSCQGHWPPRWQTRVPATDY
jgi:hypothetical protein